MYLINSGQTLEVKIQKMTDIIKIRKTESKTVRIIWYFVIIGGIYGTVKSLNSCLHQFFRYPDHGRGDHLRTTRCPLSESHHLSKFNSQSETYREKSTVYAQFGRFTVQQYANKVSF